MPQNILLKNISKYRRLLSVIEGAIPLTNYSSTLTSKEKSQKLMVELSSKIKATGPLTVADYMKEVLTHPKLGYYMDKDVFGAQGDFTTSPEISQMFGELIGIWFVNEWINNGSPNNVNLVEFGPGRGTLADDVLRTVSKFPALHKAVSMHMVEVSPKLSAIQCEKLYEPARPFSVLKVSDQDYYMKCHSKYGCDIYWYNTLKNVPKGFSLYVAHEFFDALPIHKFQKVNNTWHEIVIDKDFYSESGLKYVLAKNHTVASGIFLSVGEDDKRHHVEVCPSAGVIVSEIAERIDDYGGSALIADYGHTGEKCDTFRGFRSHMVVDPLIDPGTADLTADVDFKYLRKMAYGKVDVHGPVSQNVFLQNMGITTRLQVLLQNATREQRKDLLTGYEMLMNKEKMGERFKFMALTHKCKDSCVVNYIPAGFKDLTS